MKSTLFTLVFAALLSPPAWGQDLDCHEVKLLAKTVCEFSDGSATVVDHTNSTYAVKHYSPEEWSRLGPMIQKNVDMITAPREAEENAERQQMQKQAELAKEAADGMERDRTHFTLSHDKKGCQKAGYEWKKGQCIVKGTE